MPTLKTISKFTVIVSGGLFLTACSTTSEVRELARITAVNSSLVNTKLSDFAQNRSKIAEIRINAIASYSKEAEQQQVTFETYRQGAQAAAVIAGEKNNPNYVTLLGELERTSSVIQEYQESVRIKQASISQEILASQQPLVIHKSDLSTISKKLGVLAKEPTYVEQLQFLTGFFSAVLDDIKTAKAASDEAAKEVKATQQDKGNATTGTPAASNSMSGTSSEH
ncbi:hypothetical protein [Nitrosomonas sp.]|uniref:hypothetical protein n=1 Tax=Nitrosomonas sp. TaxID=42353 RepID=UPI00271AA490|nr:hypothetical protein [Nitrosomonas sp.]MDO8893781.1 hypothetical protein [Nitrosomonas sp.]